MKTVAIALLGIVAITMCGCRRHGEEELYTKSNEVNWTKEDEAKLQVRNAFKLEENVRKFYDQITSISNPVARAELFSKLAQATSNIDYEKWPLHEIENLTLCFCSMYEQLAYGMFMNGATELDIWNLISPAFEKYRKVCFSFGDEKDYSDGRSPEARNRRLMARVMPKSWEEETAHFEQISVGLIFWNDPDSAEKFLERWHQKFGYHGAKPEEPDSAE